MKFPKIYAAGKIWHAPHFRELRDRYDFPIISSWIDIEGDSSSPAIYQGEEISRQRIWELCIEDCRNADIMVLWCGKMDEEHRGTIMEAGHVMGLGKPVFCVNTAETFTACGISDVAFTHHPLWNFIREDGKIVSPLEGFSLAAAMSMGVREAEENVIAGPWSA